MKRDMTVVRTLVDQKVDVNAPGKDGTPPLHWLVRVDDVETALLLHFSTRADAGGVNWAMGGDVVDWCANGNAAMMRLLLDAGADANAPDPTGETPLMTASKVGNVDAVALLLIDRGAVVDARDPEFQQTALMVAVRENHLDVVRAAGRAPRGRQCEDAHWPRAGLGAAHSGARLGRRHRHSSAAGCRCAVRAI